MDLKVKIAALNFLSGHRTDSARCVQDYGRLRRDSELKIQSHDAASKTKIRYVFVFGKMLLICKPTRGDHYSFKEGLKVQDYKVQDVSSR